MVNVVVIYLEKFNCKKNFVTYIGVLLRRKCIEITQGPPGKVTRSAQSKNLLAYLWLGSLVSQPFFEIFMSLKPPFSALPCVFLLYTIVTSYVVKNAIVFRKTDIIKNRNFVVIFGHGECNIFGKIQLQKEFCYIYRCVITQKVYRNCLGTPGLEHKIRPIKKPTTFAVAGEPCISTIFRNFDVVETVFFSSTVRFFIVYHSYLLRR